MNWYYKIIGGHTHVRVFVNGAKCGDLCFRNIEFDQIRSRAKAHLNSITRFESEDATPAPDEVRE